MLHLPQATARMIGERPYTLDTLGMSDSQVICFEDMVLKIERQREESDNERCMMSWLSGRLPVPRVLCAECEDGVNYLLMTRMPGRACCSQEYMEQPQTLVRLLAQGLRMLWAADVSECPCDSGVAARLRLAGERLSNGLCSERGAEPGTYGPGGFSSPGQLYRWLSDNRPPETPTLSHGDYCLPNIFAEGSRISGFIDLGRCGMADRYQDIALCARSLCHNFSGRYDGRLYDGYCQQMLFDELGMTADRERIRYYILLDELF